MAKYLGFYDECDICDLLKFAAASSYHIHQLFFAGFAIVLNSFYKVNGKPANSNNTSNRETKVL